MALPIFHDRMSENETASALGVQPGTLAVWRCTKRYPLPYVKVGKKVFYRGQDIADFIASRTFGGDNKEAA